MSHPVCVSGAVEGGHGSVRDPAAPSSVALPRAGGEQQVNPTFFVSSSSSAPSAAAPPLASPLLVEVEVLLRLQLKAQGGVEGNEAAAGGRTAGLCDPQHPTDDVIRRTR